MNTLIVTCRTRRMVRIHVCCQVAPAARLRLKIKQLLSNVILHLLSGPARQALQMYNPIVNWSSNLLSPTSLRGMDSDSLFLKMRKLEYSKDASLGHCTTRVHINVRYNRSQAYDLHHHLLSWLPQHCWGAAWTVCGLAGQLVLTHLSI